jgi:hypothetical protein
MKTIKVILGDNKNSQYKKEIELSIGPVMYVCLKEFGDDYDKYWDKLCDKIECSGEELPYNWFIDKIKYC